MAQALDVAHRCSHLRSFAFLRHNSERCLDYGRHDKKPGRAQLNDEDARCLSSARGSRAFCVLLASYWAVKLTTKNTKDTENFALFFRFAGRLRSGERGLLARSARQLAEQKFPRGRRRSSVRVAHVCRVLAMTSRHRGLLRKNCFGETPKVRAGLAFA